MKIYRNWFLVHLVLRENERTHYRDSWERYTECVMCNVRATPSIVSTNDASFFFFTEGARAICERSLE